MLYLIWLINHFINNELQKGFHYCLLEIYGKLTLWNICLLVYKLTVSNF